ncbi:hypothetical protein B0H10DRAFT_673290 [Mycena sp. CBHHK59/15]|nr:hypothetical protein B0H10DRAFT_673290 [Mycena sp. CBHHK59/15]
MKIAMDPGSSLLDLPNEILLLITEDLDNDALLHLAIMCKRLNLLLMPSLFEKYDIRLSASTPGGDPTVSFLGRSVEVLPVLARAFYVNALSRLECDFAYKMKPSSFDDLQVSLKAIAALRELAVRLSHLGHVRFDPGNSWYSRRTPEDSAEWSRRVAEMFNSVSERADSALTVAGGCTDTLADARPFVHAIPQVPQRTAPFTKTAVHSHTHGYESIDVRSVLRRFGTAIARLFGSYVAGAPGPTLEGAEQSEEVSSDLPSTINSEERPTPIALPTPLHPALRTFNIHASFLFHTTFYRWTLNVLNTAPLTELSLDDIDLTHYDWALILPTLTLPALEALAINRCAVAVPDLALFLARHPTLLTLGLSFHLAIGALVPGPSTDALPRLVRLCATPDYLCHFLAPRGACPDLREVVVASDGESTYEIARFRQVVECVRQRRAVVPRVTLVGKLGKFCEVPEDLAEGRRVSETQG